MRVFEESINELRTGNNRFTKPPQNINGMQNTDNTGDHKYFHSDVQNKKQVNSHIKVTLS